MNLLKGILFLFLVLIVCAVRGQIVAGVSELDVSGLRAVLKPFPEMESSAYLSQFRIPGDCRVVVSGYGPRWGRMHYGVDLRMPKGDTVRAAQSGMVVRSNWGYGYGYLLVVQHRHGIQTYYAHLSKFLKKKGEWVKKGEPIALSGNTGRSRGPHLHFEMREKGRPFDPELVFDFKQQKIRDAARDEDSLLALHRKLKPQGYGNHRAVPEYYRVRSGDTLYSISRRFRVSIKELCRLNRIRESSIIRVGQPLRMY